MKRNSNYFDMRLGKPRFEYLGECVRIVSGSVSGAKLKPRFQYSYKPRYKINQNFTKIQF